MAAQSTEPSDPAAPPASKPVEALPTAGLEQAALPAEPNLAKQPPTGQPIERLNEVAQPPAAKPAPAEQNGEPRIAAEKKPANQDGEPKPAEQPQAAKPAEPEKPAEQRKAEALGGLLSLFEDEEATLTALDELCRTLPNIEVDELLAGCRQALQQFQMSAPLAYEMAEERAR